MSVIAYEYNEFEGVANSLKEMPSLKETVMNNAYVKKYNSRPMPEQFKYSFEDAVDRLLWYMYVANRVAYSLQYQENTDIFTTEQKAEVYTPEQSAEKFSSFMYNIYTNSGNVFLSNDWLGLGEDIQKFLKKKFNMDYEAGGTLPTPFGQAGLVGETGAMNEMELFAMGGNLPQGVHQYFQQTNNPAFPTPHGYAKGGEVGLEKEKARLKKLYKSKNFEKLMGEELAKRTQKSMFDRIDRLGTVGYPSSSGWVRGGERDSVESVEEAIKGIEAIWSNKMAKGGRLKSALMRDRKYFNKDESWERQYSKNKPKRKGYKEKGGEVKKKRTNRGGIMQLAKKIRKDGEAWKDALKRAGAMLRDK